MTLAIVSTINLPRARTADISCVHLPTLDFPVPSTFDASSGGELHSWFDSPLLLLGQFP